MNKNRRALFISDLHLEEGNPYIVQLFLRLLAECDAENDVLYILGDLFEVWIGDDDLSPFHLQIINTLKAATQKGLRIGVMHGNRDFLLGKKFLRMTGCHFLPDETVIDAYGTRLLLMHGDTLCTEDIAYQKARKKFRKRWRQFLFLLLPLSKRRQIAAKMRAASKHYVEAQSMEIMDVTQNAVMDVMSKHDVRVLIHGHTHQPAMHALTLKNNPATRIVLAPWHTEGHVFIWQEDGKTDSLTLR